MNDDTRGRLRSMVEGMGIVMTPEAAMERLRGLHDTAHNPDARDPAGVLKATEDLGWVAAISACDDAQGLIYEMRSVYRYAGACDALTIAIRRARVTVAGAPEPEVLERLKMRIGADYEPKGPEHTSRNAAIVLECDTRWHGRFRFDEFANQLEIDGRPVQDIDEVRIQHWLDAEYGIQIGPKTTGEAVAVVGTGDTFHPVRDYLSGVKWDGQPRIDRWLVDYCQSPDKRIVCAYARRFLISAVARVFDPGCKVDTTLILQGDQGAKKSTALRALASPRWFSDSAVDLRSKDAMQVMTGVWIYEFAEMDAIRRQDFSVTKAFLTSRVDRYRPAFGRHVVSHARQGIIAGTTNDEQALPADPSGSRRYWPVQVGSVDAEGLLGARDQLWAEAVAAYRDGEQWWLTDDEERRRVKSEDLFCEVDAWQDVIEAWCVGKLELTTAGVWVGALEKRPGDLNQGSKLRIARILRGLDYRPERHRTRGRFWGK